MDKMKSNQKFGNQELRLKGKIIHSLGGRERERETNQVIRHLDSVRTVCFHPTEMIAASGSDDGTVKVWNLQRTTGKDGNAIKK